MSEKKRKILSVFGTRPEAIYAAAAELLTDEKAYKAMAWAVSPYGDGHASARIVRHLQAFLAEK